MSAVTKMSSTFTNRPRRVLKSPPAKLDLEEGVYRYLKYPSREITVYFPRRVDSGNLEVFIGYRVLHSAVRGPGKGGIRFAPDVSLDEVRALAGLDDLEVRRGEYSLRRREGRRDLRSHETFENGTRAHHPALHRRIQRMARAGARCSRPGYRHKRSNHGLGDGHLFDARPAGHHRRGDRQAARFRRLPRPQGSHRPRADDCCNKASKTQDEARRLPRHHSGLRQCRLAGGAYCMHEAGYKIVGVAEFTAASITKRVSTSKLYDWVYDQRKPLPEFPGGGEKHDRPGNSLSPMRYTDSRRHRKSNHHRERPPGGLQNPLRRGQRSHHLRTPTKWSSKRASSSFRIFSATPAASPSAISNGCRTARDFSGVKAK